MFTLSNKMKKKLNPFILVIISLIISLGTTNLQAKTQILAIPFTVIPQSSKSIAQQINHTISFTLMHQPDTNIIQTNKSFSPSEILTPGFQKKISQMASAQNCSHIIYGSVNIFGQSLSMNAVLLDRTKKTIVHSSTDTLNKVDQIPDWLNNWIINALQKMSPAQSSRTAHQIRMETIPDELIGMDIADINQDQESEILLYGPKQIMVVDKAFTTINIRRSGFGKTVVFARWFDDSKTAPFLIVSETSGSDINTGLYQWENNQWQVQHNYSGWFLAGLTATKTIIAQQRRHTDYWGNIMKMKGQLPDKFVSTPFEMPFDANIFDFNVFYVKNQPLFIRFNHNDRLSVFRNQNLIWRSSHAMGGSIHFFEVQTDSGQMDSVIRKYIPSRLLVCDLDHDQSDEIIVCKNSSTTGRIFEKTRLFSHGEVHVLKWTGSEMQRVWISKKQPGPVTAYALEKIDDQWRLWLACVLKQKSLFWKGLSRIAVYKIQ
jgi:TolB-like protein